MFKLFYFIDDMYRPIRGLWSSVDSCLDYLTIRFGVGVVRRLRSCNFIKIPFLGYHSNDHTGFSLSDLRVPRSKARRPEK